MLNDKHSTMLHACIEGMCFILFFSIFIFLLSNFTFYLVTILITYTFLHFSFKLVSRRFVKSRNITILYECLSVLYIYKTFNKKPCKSIYDGERM